MDIILFWIILLLALIVIFSYNIVYAIVSFVLLILNSVIILFLIDIEFLSLVFLLIYVGAILVIFLFMSLFLNLNVSRSKQQKSSLMLSTNLVYFLILVKLFLYIYYFTQSYCYFISTSSKMHFFFNILNEYSFTNWLLASSDGIIFVSLFTQRYGYLILVSIVLLFAMVGSIILYEKKGI
jgi:NADH:ubiquinone oxidoreductase subunit 6 (subunit J)